MNALDRIAATLEADGLRPVIDPVMDLILADCPDCDAGATDPLGLWRPLQIIPRRGHTAALCDACGVTRV